MWINFFAACLLAIFLMYVPGCLAFGESLAKKKTLLAWAPFISLFLLFAFGEAFYVAHVQVSGLVLLCVTTAAGLLIGAISYFLNKRITRNGNSRARRRQQFCHSRAVRCSWSGGFGLCFFVGHRISGLVRHRNRQCIPPERSLRHGFNRTIFCFLD